MRHRGTIGGSLANNDPMARHPAAALGLGATIQTHTRTIAAADFFKGPYDRALKVGEVFTAVRFPVPEKSGLQKFRPPASRFSIVGVFASKGPLGVRAAVTGAGSGVFRAKDPEAKLAASWSAAALAGATVSAARLKTATCTARPNTLPR